MCWITTAGAVAVAVVASREEDLGAALEAAFALAEPRADTATADNMVAGADIEALLEAFF